MCKTNLFWFPCEKLYVGLKKVGQHRWWRWWQISAIRWLKNKLLNCWHDSTIGIREGEARAVKRGCDCAAVVVSAFILFFCLFVLLFSYLLFCHYVMSASLCLFMLSVWLVFHWIHFIICVVVVVVIVVITVVGFFLFEMKCYIPMWTTSMIFLFNSIENNKISAHRWAALIQPGFSRSWAFPPCQRSDCISLTNMRKACFVDLFFPSLFIEGETSRLPGWTGQTNLLGHL